MYKMYARGDMMKEIQRLQDNLLLVRRAVGWTAAEFGDRIGVTRQTINNLEMKRTELNKTQYIAIRAVLDAEMAAAPEETKMLGVILEVFVDNPEKYKESDRKQLLEKANMLTPSILAGTSKRADVSKAFMENADVIGLVIGMAIPIVGTAAKWLKTILKEKLK